VQCDTLIQNPQLNLPTSVCGAFQCLSKPGQRCLDDEISRFRQVADSLKPPVLAGIAKASTSTDTSNPTSLPVFALITRIQVRERNHTSSWLLPQPEPTQPARKTLPSTSVLIISRQHHITALHLTSPQNPPYFHRSPALTRYLDLQPHRTADLYSVQNTEGDYVTRHQSRSRPCTYR
jgi:hypothetical protein